MSSSSSFVLAVVLGLAFAPRAGAAVVPIACVRGASPGVESGFSCFRLDTRASFSTVPEGMFLHVLGIHATPNDESTSGIFTAQVGRNDAGELPVFPSLDLTGGAIGVNALRFRTPYLVLREGESLALANLAQSEVPIGAYLTGFLAPTARVPEPAPASSALGALCAVGALASLPSMGRKDIR